MLLSLSQNCKRRPKPPSTPATALRGLLRGLALRLGLPPTMSTPPPPPPPQPTKQDLQTCLHVVRAEERDLGRWACACAAGGGDIRFAALFLERWVLYLTMVPRVVWPWRVVGIESYVLPHLAMHSVQRGTCIQVPQHGATAGTRGSAGEESSVSQGVPSAQGDGAGVSPSPVEHIEAPHALTYEIWELWCLPPGPSWKLSEMMCVRSHCRAPHDRC